MSIIIIGSIFVAFQNSGTFQYKSKSFSRSVVRKLLVCYECHRRGAPLSSDGMTTLIANTKTYFDVVNKHLVYVRDKLSRIIILSCISCFPEY